jgi:hypothetical protein
MMSVGCGPSADGPKSWPPFSNITKKLRKAVLFSNITKTVICRPCKQQPSFTAAGKSPIAFYEKHCSPLIFFGIKPTS